MLCLQKFFGLARYLAGKQARACIPPSAPAIERCLADSDSDSRRRTLQALTAGGLDVITRHTWPCYKDAMTLPYYKDGITLLSITVVEGLPTCAEQVMSLLGNVFAPQTTRVEDEW